MQVRGDVKMSNLLFHHPSEGFIISFPAYNITRMTKMRFALLIIPLLFFGLTGFDFRELQTTVSVTTINAISNYSFVYDRKVDNNYFLTNYNNQTVPANANITVTFPVDYISISTVACLSLSVNGIAITNFTCSKAGNTVTFQGGLLSVSNLYVTGAVAVIGNVLNPVPAIYTRGFTGTIGSDVAVSAGTGVQLTAGYLSNCSLTFSPNTVYTTGSTMVIGVTPANALSSGSTVKVQFPRSSWTNDIKAQALPITSSMVCTNYSTNINSVISCVGSGGTLITASNMFSSTVFSAFSFGVGSFLSPPSIQPSDSITITTYMTISGTSYKVDTCNAYPSGLVASAFNTFTVAPTATMTVNSQVGLRFSANFSAPINQADYFQITIPSSMSFTLNQVYGAILTPSTTISGSIITIVDATTSSFTRDQSFVYILTAQYFKAPPSTLTTSPFSFSVLRNGYPIMSGSTTLTATAGSLTASASTAVSTVWQNTSYIFSITTSNTLSSSGMIRVVLPSQVTLNTSSTSCASLSGSGTATQPLCSFSSSNTILLNSINSSSSTIPAQTLTLTINGLTNPGDASASSSFSISTYYSNTLTGMTDSGSAAGITATVGTIDVATVSITPSSYVVYQTGVTYTFTFNNTFPIPIGGLISVTMPTDIGLNTANLATYSKYSLNGGTFISIPATFITSSSYQLNFTNIATTAAIPAGSRISLQLAGICTNPSSTRIVSPFGITTRSSIAPIESVSGMSLQMTIPADFYIVDVARNSQQNSALASYTFTLKQQAALIAGSLLLVDFPSDIAMTIGSTCTNLAGTVITCTQTSYQGLVVTLEAVGAGVQFGVVVNQVRNPPSYRPSTANFVFATKTADQLSSYAYRTIVNPLTNSVPSTFTSVSYSFSPAAYANAQSLTITLAPAGFVAPSVFLVALAPSLIPTTISCNSYVGFIGSCALASSSTSTVNVTGMTGTSQVTFTITGFTSPESAPSDYSTITSFEGGYMVSQNTGQILFAAKCVVPCRTCSSGNTSACLTCYNNAAITANKYYNVATLQCLSTCPDGSFESSLTCPACSTTCLTCDLLASNCTSCNLSGSYPALSWSGSSGSCLSACPIYYYLSNATTPSQCVRCDNTTYHCLTCTSLTACASCYSGTYFSSGTCTTLCPSNTTIANSASWTCEPCSSECATCSITVTNCTSCSSTSAYYNGQCLSACPYPLVISAGTCGSCDSSCKVCSLIATNCTACYTSTAQPYLIKTIANVGSCTNTCPYSYYGDQANGVCVSCNTLNIGCTNCSSQTTCYDCNTGYIFYLNTCSLTAPVGYFNESGVATKCDPSCATCSTLATNCTACIGALSLSGNACVSTCNAGQVAVSNVCVDCAAATPYFCRTCLGSTTYCTNCALVTPMVFLSSGSCQTTCPNYTYPDSSTLTCKVCPTDSHCQMCTTSYSCTSCVSGYYLYNSTCASTCPTQYIPLDRKCVACTNNCFTCTGATSICTSCQTGYYLYNSTSPSCVNPCPTSLFMNNDTETCTGCSILCATCGTYSTQCLSCASNTYLQGSSCLSTCNVGYYAVGMVCTLCPSSCSACSSNLTCSACAPNYYLYLSSCVTSCPAIRPIVNVNGACSSCTNVYCVSCSSSNYCSSCFFPQLLIQGTCVTTCPKDYVVDSTGTQCSYSPDTNTTITPKNTTLTDSLTTASTFPVPFTVAAGFFGVACLMSKFQHERTHLAGALYSLWGLLEWASIGFLLLYYKFLGRQTMKLSYWLLLGGMAGLYLLNLIFLVVQNISLRNDKRLKSWLGGTFNTCWYYLLSFLGLLTTNKFKNLLFSKLFAFSVFSVRLESIHQLKSYNAFGFFAFVPALATIAGTGMLVYETTAAYDQLFMAQIDVLILSILVLVLALCHIRKDQDFFEDTDEDGLHINKRVNALDQILNGEVMPEYGEETQKSYLERYESARKFRVSSVGDCLSEVGSLKSLRDISVQAEQILGERSLISRLGTESISDLSMSMFHKNDVSLQFDEKRREMIDMSVGQNVFVLDASVSPQSVHQRDVSIDVERPILMDVSVDQTVQEKNEVSVQYETRNKSMSIQYDMVQQNQVSIQHVPVYTDQTVHMTKDEQEIAIQCAPMNQSQSIQYSAKPVIEHIEDDLPSQSISFEMSKQEEEPSDLDLQRRLLEGGVAPMEEGLRPELEIDIEEKLEKKRQELLRLQQERLEREKEQAKRQFQQRVQQKENISFKDGPQSQQQRLDNIFNNETGEAPSSLMMTQEVIQINLPPRPPRPQTARTEQQLINMLSGDKSSSRNVSKDSGVRGRVHIQSGDTLFDYEDNQGLEQEEQEELQQELAQNTIEQFPSAEKSRSTANMTGRIGGRGPILEDSEVSFNFSKRDQSINQHPMEPTHQRPYKQEELNMAKKTNLTQFLQKKRGNISSANPGLSRKNPMMQEEDALEREIQQRPLVPQRSEHVFTQESGSSNRKRSFKVEALEFDNNDHVYIPEEDELQDALQQQAKRVLPRKNSLKKVPSRDMLMDRPSREGLSNSKGYLKSTYTSEEKRKSLQKIYLNKLKK